ncbi:MAG: EAL domain-containing protein, partial [Clostridia bacterium]|nr:EAL domain-containing protein [Clostridia bacterium]
MAENEIIENEAVETAEAVEAVATSETAVDGSAKKKTEKKTEAKKPRKTTRRRNALRPIEFLFQQIYDTSGNAVVGYECMLQINDKKLGCLTYDKIASVAERTTLISRLGNWALEEACEVLKRTYDAGKHVHLLFLPLSPKHIIRPDFFDKLDSILKKYDISYGRFVFEIYDSEFFNYGKEFSKAIAALREKGVKIALKDFGAESSSLTKLHDMQIDYLMLDPEFMTDITNKRSRDITESIVEMAQKLDIMVIGTGVDTKEQLNVTKEM